MRTHCELFWVFWKIGALTFGGGYAMISMLEYECVQKRQWITAEELLNIIAIAESTPGPISINCATYTGYRRAGIFGAIMSTIGITLPGALIFFMIALFLEDFLSVPAVFNIFKGMRVAISLMIVKSGIRMLGNTLRKTTQRKLDIIISVSYFTVAFLLRLSGMRLSTIYLILSGGIIGLCLYWLPQKKRREAEEK